MKFGVIIFPGSNCDRDIIHVLKNVLHQEVLEIWHKDTEIEGFEKEDCLVLPGGFSYGDYLRSGAIARFSPVMETVIKHANNGGKVLGICNGFQILCEAGLLPGALLRNKNQRFVCKNVYLKAGESKNPLTQYSKEEGPLKIPVAHAEGRYYADRNTIESLFEQEQVLFQYCDENGCVNEIANFNGSEMNIAGICNRQGNVMGMMPHPERAAEEDLHNTDGFQILRGLIETLN